MERCLACEAERGRHPWSAAYRRLTCAPDVGGRASSRAATGLRRGVRKTLDLLCTALREPLVAGTQRHGVRKTLDLLCIALREPLIAGTRSLPGRKLGTPYRLCLTEPPHRAINWALQSAGVAQW